MLFLKDILDTEELNKCIEQGYIKERENPNVRGMYVLKYTRKTQLNGYWNQETMNCRGLIVYSENRTFDEDTIVLERPFKKFFTVEQLTNSWNNDSLSLVDDEENEKLGEIINEVIELDAPVRVYDKVDGCLLISYFDSGNMLFATSGSFSSEEAVLFNNLIKSKADYKSMSNILKELNDNYTLIFEGLSPRKHVITYDDYEIRFIGAIEKRTGRYIAPCDFSEKNIVDSFFNSVEKLQAGSLREALELPGRTNSEGFVVSTIGETQHIYKYKCDSYSIFRKILRNPYKYMFTLVRPYLLEGDLDFNYKNIIGVEEIWGELSSANQNFIEGTFNKIVSYYKDIINRVETIVANEKKSNLSLSNKELYLKYKDNEDVSMIMKCLAGKEFNLIALNKTAEYARTLAVKFNEE